jgi:hypothetical protein
MLQVILDMDGNFFIFLKTFAEAHIWLFSRKFLHKVYLLEKFPTLIVAKKCTFRKKKYKKNSLTLPKITKYTFTQNIPPTPRSSPPQR